MNHLGYLKFILTVIALLLAAGIYLGVQAVDRNRETTRKLGEKLDRIADRLRELPAAARPVPQPVREKRDSTPFANAAYFDPEAVKGGRLILATLADVSNMNDLINNDATVSGFHGFCNSSLAARDYEKPEEYQPLLAESWTISDDHLSYRIKLRRGVYWHDFTDPVTGKEHRDVEVTAHDFKFAMDVIRNPEVNCEPLRNYYQDFDSLEVLNDYEFIVRWKRPYYGSIACTLGMTPLPRHLYHAYDGPFDGRRFNDDHERNRLIVGCGPYQFAGWEKDRRVLFRRNPRYFGEAFGAGPSIDTIVCEVIKLPNTRYQALLAGQLDQLDLTPDQWTRRCNEEPFRDGSIKRYRYLQPNYSYIGWNLNNPLFTDKRVRQALTMLIDRERILHDVYFDLAEIAKGPFFPRSSYSDPALKPWPFDPERAKQLLVEAGWRDEDGDGILEKEGRKFTFTMLQIATSSIQPRMMPLIQETLAAAGIDMKIQNLEWSVYLQRLQDKNFEACCLGWQSPFDPDPYQIWHSSQADLPGSSNHIGFRNHEADRLIEELRATFDMERRIELARRFEALLHEEQPYTFLFVPYQLEARSGRYRNVRVFPGGIPDLIQWVPQAEQRPVPGL